MSLEIATDTPCPRRRRALAALLDRVAPARVLESATARLRYGPPRDGDATSFPNHDLLADRQRWRLAAEDLLARVGKAIPWEQIIAERSHDLPAIAWGIMQGWGEGEARDEHGRPRPEDALLARAGLLDRPVIDEMTTSLGAHLGLSNAGRWDGHDWAFCLTFDIDSAGFFGGRSGLRNVANAFRAAGPAPTANRLASWPSVALGRRPDPHIDLAGLALRLRAPATFFAQAKRLHALDGYSLAREPHLVRQLRRLRQLGCEVALHSSYATPDLPDRALARQRATLRRLTGTDSTAVRGHYLRVHNPERTGELPRAGLAIECSAGYSRQEGFRIGTAMPVPGEDVAVTSVPFAAMDVTLRHHRHMNPDAAFERCVDLMERVRATGGCAVLLWHPHNMDPLLWPGWQDLPLRLEEWALENGARAGTISEAASLWEASRYRLRS